MTISIQEQITRELARLRMWRYVANDEESLDETNKTHARINYLLDQLDHETQSKVSQKCQSTTLL